MARLFRIKWPGFAVLEAYLLFAGFLGACATSANLRSALIPSATHIAGGFDLPGQILFWTLLLVMVAPPFLCAMLAVDRLLTVRRGFAVLSLLSVPAWAAVAEMLSDHLTHGAPDKIWSVTIAAGCASLLMHGPSLWVGLTDRGIVALRLIARSSTLHTPAPARAADAPIGFVPNPRGRIVREPDRRDRLAMIAACAFAAVAGIASYRLYRAPAAGGPPVVVSRPVAIPRSDIPDLFIPPFRPPPEPDPPAPMPRETVPPLPQVWAPGQAGPRIGGAAHQATAVRRRDGFFVFDATVNGHPTSMLFDTGASTVLLRAEEAERLGVEVGRLNFNVKTWTANGTALAAATRIDELTVGSITRHGVRALVASPGALAKNLLGQSFLRSLQEIRIEDKVLTLQDR